MDTYINSSLQQWKSIWNKLVWILLLILNFCQQGSGDYTGKVLLVGFDGFRWDYMTVTDTPNFHKVKQHGTSVPYINNVFTSITFPSMYSIVTGLYPETHGIVGYAMYDSTWNETWTHLNTESKWFNDGEPIWVTARREGLDSGSYFWLGSEVRIRGYLPNHWVPYNESHAFRDRVDEVIRWFTEEDVSVVALYFHEPDSTGHYSGPAPESKKTVAMIQEADKIVGYLLEQMAEHDLDNEVNLLITSDHGMTECSLTDKLINLYDYVPASLIRIVADEGAVANILPVEGKTAEVFNALKAAHPNMSVYHKQEVPDRFHFKKHRRIHPIVAIADEGWLIVANGSWPAPMYGMHGYDNELMSMKPFFLAMGPDIKENYQSEVFDQVDIYIFMCELLGIEPSPNNGSLTIIGRMLKESHFTSAAICTLSNQSHITLFLISLIPLILKLVSTLIKH